MDYDSIVEMDAGACVGHASPHALLADSQSLLSKLVALNEGGGVFLTDSSLIWDLHKSLGNGVWNFVRMTARPRGVGGGDGRRDPALAALDRR